MTNPLTPWSVVVQKLEAVQIAKKLPAFYGRPPNPVELTDDYRERNIPSFMKH
jgi:hypothetical protein